MGFHNNKTLLSLDELVNEFVIFLVYIQQSVSISMHEKISVFNHADLISGEIFAVVQKLSAAKVNKFNTDDVNIYLDKHISEIIDNISQVMSFYRKKTHIRNETLFYLNEIIDTLTERKDTVSLGKDKVRKLFSYKELLKDPKAEEETKKLELSNKQIRESFNKEFDNIKLKSFRNMIRGVNHSNEEYFYRTNNFVIQNYLNSKIGVITPALKEKVNQGVFFIPNNNNEIGIVIAENSLRIEYGVKIQHIDETVNIFIQGYINHNNSQVDFYIDESYLSKQIEAVLNGYNIKTLIDRYNEVYLDYFKKAKEEDAEEMNKKHIDDFLSGKII